MTTVMDPMTHCGCCNAPYGIRAVTDAVILVQCEQCGFSALQHTKQGSVSMCMDDYSSLVQTARAAEEELERVEQLLKEQKERAVTLCRPARIWTGRH